MSDRFDGLKVLGRTMIVVGIGVVLLSVSLVVAGAAETPVPVAIVLFFGGRIEALADCAPAGPAILGLICGAVMILGGLGLVAVRRWGRMVTISLALVCAAALSIDAIRLVVSTFREPAWAAVAGIIMHAFGAYLCYLVIEYLTEAGVSGRLRAAATPKANA